MLLFRFRRVLAEAHEDSCHLSPGGGALGIQDASVLPAEKARAHR